MTEPVARTLRPNDDGERATRSPREWLVTNGLGGYASGTVSGIMSRRYHALLVAALPAPAGRTVMLSQVTERLLGADGAAVVIGGRIAYDRGRTRLTPPPALAEFALDWGLPCWRYAWGGVLLEKRLLMPHRQNTVHITYQHARGETPIRLELRPAVNIRAHDAPVSQSLGEGYRLTVAQDRYELAAGPESPVLRFRLWEAMAGLRVVGKPLRQLAYAIEASRGYPATGDLWSPGYFRLTLSPGEEVSLIASTETWDVLEALSPTAARTAESARRRRLVAAAPPAARHGMAAELVLAADQFIISPAGRLADAALTQAWGDDARTVIAGYHWFTDWGRDTMITLEGLTLTTGRQVEAGYILRTFAHYVRDGLIPNVFPEGRREGYYHTADATLWFFHALDRYLEATRDRTTLRLLLPVLLDIVDHHVRGTRFGIGVDPADGLLCQGEAGYALTWMDAKAGDWVVTPRRGKAVEINALWYNALRLLADWSSEEEAGTIGSALRSRAADVAKAFNDRFWYGAGGYLYDLVDGETGDDDACRPNQLLAFSLRHPVLDPERWAPVLEVVERLLVTPFGLRTLAPGHRDYKPTYHGDLPTRDAAYHQGTVWPWLLGPFVDAWLRVHPEDPKGARRFVDAFAGHLDEGCVGSISEIFDAEPPFVPRGCIAQGWSVAEVLRTWVKTSAEA